MFLLSAVSCAIVCLTSDSFWPLNLATFSFDGVAYVLEGTCYVISTLPTSSEAIFTVLHTWTKAGLKSWRGACRVTCCRAVAARHLLANMLAMVWEVDECMEG